MSLALFACAANPGQAAETPAPASPPEKALSATNSGPRIQFAELLYDFGKMDSGEVIKHDFVFTNTGTQMLEISMVRPGCGCTAAGTWDKQVEPGKTGKIPIQFNSGGYGGLVMKTIFVTCNDPVQTNLNLQLKGTIFKPIDVTPAMAMFTPGPDIQTNEVRVIKIVNNLEESVTISEPVCTNNAFRAELKSVREGKEFELRISATPPFASTHLWTPIMLKTSSSRMTNITVNCYLNVQPAIAVLPSQITLPAGALTNAARYVVTIQNNSANTVSLSEPSVNIEGAEVKLQEIKPGRQFNLTAIFPVGFKSQPGQAMEVSVKSSHPNSPLVKIPVIQMPSTPSAALPAPATPAVKPSVQQSSSENPSSSAAGAKLPTTLAAQKAGAGQ